MITTKEIQYLRKNWNGYVGNCWGEVPNEKSIEMLLAEKRGIIFEIKPDYKFFLISHLNKITPKILKDIIDFLEYSSFEEYRKEKSINSKNVYKKICKKLYKSDDLESERIYVL